MAEFKDYHWIYPPRPENAVPVKLLPDYDNGRWLAEPKLNGDSCVIFTNGKDLVIRNRHGEKLTRFKLEPHDIINTLYKGEGWMAVLGEYMDKNKSDEKFEKFNHKFILFDILVYNGEYLLGKTFQERYELMNELYGAPVQDKLYIHHIAGDFYKVIEIPEGEYEKTFNHITQYDMYEGLVLKKKFSPLERGDREKNNTKSQVKFRKPTKNYAY